MDRFAFATISALHSQSYSHIHSLVADDHPQVVDIVERLPRFDNRCLVSRQEGEQNKANTFLFQYAKRVVKVMRLLIAWMERDKALMVQNKMEEQALNWGITIVCDGWEALLALQKEPYDVLLLHACLPKLDGQAVLGALWHDAPVCPPRILLLAEPELLLSSGEKRADCTISFLTSADKMARLVLSLAGEPLPRLASAAVEKRTHEIKNMLDLLALSPAYKGYDYLLWLLERIVPSPPLEEELMSYLYPACAEAFETKPASVERCVRHAIESVFTHGSLNGIERCFGLKVDPERGKLTNRAFLIASAQWLRARLSHYSLASTLSRNSSEMHHSPAAPTSV